MNVEKTVEKPKKWQLCLVQVKMCSFLFLTSNVGENNVYGCRCQCVSVYIKVFIECKVREVESSLDDQEKSFISFSCFLLKFRGNQVARVVY